MGLEEVLVLEKEMLARVEQDRPARLLEDQLHLSSQPDLLEHSCTY